jgi:Domain of unknown function (DU1801)
MAKNKTTENSASVTKFINTVTDETKRRDSFRIIEIIENLTGIKAKMWGPAIVGFGTFHYKYESGREGDSPFIAFSPRVNGITLYLDTGFPKRDALLKKFGKHTTSKACIYIKKLEDINIEIFKEMVVKSVEHVKSPSYKMNR